MLRRLALAVVTLLLSSGLALATCPNACFWIGGTATLDLLTDTLHWSASSGGASCTPCLPNSSSTLTFDASSGGGTVTVNVAGGTLTVAGITMGAFTGTLDFAANDNNVAVGASGVSLTGTGTRDLEMGDGTWTISASVNPWLSQTATNFTFHSNGSTLVFSDGSASVKTVALGNTALTYNIITFNAQTSLGGFTFTGTPTITTLNIAAPNTLVFSAATWIVTNGLTITGSGVSTPVGLLSATSGTAATISSATNTTCAGCAVRDMTFSGGGTFTGTNSFNLGHNTGVTITAPSTGGGGGIIGG